VSSSLPVSDNTLPGDLHLDQLQGQLVLLMNRYAIRADAQVARAIRDTMLGILSHPLIELFPDVQTQCARTLNHWRARCACGSEPRASVH
jgi:hypothetical protein